MQAQGMVLSPKCPAKMSGRLERKTEDTLCAPHFLFLKTDSKMGGIREVVKAGKHQEKIKKKQVNQDGGQAAVSSKSEKWYSYFWCHLPRP